MSKVEKDLLRLTAFEQGPQVLDRKYGALDVGAEVGAQSQAARRDVSEERPRELVKLKER
jgi:hypothetical protein